MTRNAVIRFLQMQITASGMSQNKFAEKIGVDRGNLSKVLNGRLPIPKKILKMLRLEKRVVKKEIYTRVNP